MTVAAPADSRLFLLHPPNPNPNPHRCKAAKPLQFPRRRLFLLPAISLLPFSSCAALPAGDGDGESPSSSSAGSATSPSSAVGPVITNRVFIDFAVCPNYLRSDRPLGVAADLAACPDAEPLGRVVFGLYGRRVPITTSNFLAVCAAASFRGTLVHKLLPGRFFVAGHQGHHRGVDVRPPPGLAANPEAVDPRAFELRHVRPGTLSLCLGQNDDEADVKLDLNYHNVEFLVTTGPGPCPELDGENIVFGTVVEGMDVITKIATIPTYKPAERIRQFNDFAEFIGDERAQIARTMWNRPLKTVYISDCGVVNVTRPSLSPSLP